MAEIVKKAKGGKKNRKYGRNEKSCQRYKLSHRREHNKARKLKKHLIRFVSDKVAQNALDRCIAIIRS